ncbi:hypothetical protein N9X61_03130 [Sulfurimonas sp.]|nr:hypothetical protein [Sulfurimonas sp.]
MSVLTQNERDGLDEVFLSIHSNNKSYVKELFHFMSLKKSKFSNKKTFNRLDQSKKVKSVLRYFKEKKKVSVKFMKNIKKRNSHKR